MLMLLKVIVQCWSAADSTLCFMQTWPSISRDERESAAIRQYRAVSSFKAAPSPRIERCRRWSTVLRQPILWHALRHGARDFTNS